MYRCRRRVLDLLADLQRERNTTYIFIAHDLAVVRAIADRVAVLYQGRLCEIGTVDEIYSPPFHPYTETLLGAVLVPDPDYEPQLLASDTPELAPPAQGLLFPAALSLLSWEMFAHKKHPPGSLLQLLTGTRFAVTFPSRN